MGLTRPPPALTRHNPLTASPPAWSPPSSRGPAFFSLAYQNVPFGHVSGVSSRWMLEFISSLVYPRQYIILAGYLFLSSLGNPPRPTWLASLAIGLPPSTFTRLSCHPVVLPRVSSSLFYRLLKNTSASWLVH